MERMPEGRFALDVQRSPRGELFPFGNCARLFHKHSSAGTGWPVWEFVVSSLQYFVATREHMPPGFIEPSNTDQCLILFFPAAVRITCMS